MFFPSIESPCKSYLTGYIYNLPGKLDHHILKPLALLSRVPGVCCDHAVTMRSPWLPPASPAWHHNHTSASIGDTLASGDQVTWSWWSHWQQLHPGHWSVRHDLFRFYQQVALEALGALGSGLKLPEWPGLTRYFAANMRLMPHSHSVQAPAHNNTPGNTFNTLKIERGFRLQVPT